MPIVAAVLLCAFAVQPAFAVYAPIGTSKPNLPGGSVANDQPPLTFFQGQRPPYPTGDWWAGFGASPNQDAIAGGPFPYQSRCLSNGIQFGISSKRDFDGVSVHQPSNMEWSASFAEHDGKAVSHKALVWDEQTVTVQYFNSSAATMNSWMPGSPYMTFNYTTASPTFTSLCGKITAINAKTVLPSTITCESAIRFKIVTTGATYILYSLRGAITLCSDKTTNPTVLTSVQRISGVMRMAKLGNASHEATLDTYKANYPISMTMDYTFSGSANANLVFLWNVVGDPSKLLMLTWPHHRKSLISPNYLATSAISYMTTKGYMYPHVGSKWTLSYVLPTIDFNAPRAPQSSCKQAILNAVEYEVNNLGTPPKPGEFYFWGGSIAASARLGLIADQVGRADLVQKVVVYLTTSLGYWTNPSYTTVQASYETTWGGVINKAGATNVNVDFGNGYYNDHHFHYGYFLTAGAVIAKFNPSWLKVANGLGTNNDFLSWMVRDIANPSVHGDPYFPLTRHRDWLAGHSWASGIANGGAGRDQESIGEAVNGYYGVLLYATVTNNTNLRNYARLLIATEQQAAQTYWHLYPSMKSTDAVNPYPEASTRNLITMGNIYDWQAGAFLFWGSQRSEIAAIQILPVTPINEYMYDAEWTTNVLSYVATELSDPAVDDAWKAVIYQAYGNGNPQKAMALSASLSSWGSGNSYSNQLYFIATRPNPSGAAICTSTQNGLNGTWILQDVKSGKYVTSSSSQPDLVAGTSTTRLAAPFKLSAIPGGTTMQCNSSSLFVTADQTGKYALSASRTTASTWETMSFQLQDGTSDQYTIVARSNKNYVVLDSNGALMPSALSSGNASIFRLLTPPAPVAYSGPSGTWALQEVSSGRYVTSTTSRTDLYADATSSANAQAWNFGSPQGATTIQSNSTGQYVTADNSGTLALSAIRTVAQGWELFTFTVKDGTSNQYTIVASSNSKYVSLDSKGALIPSATSVKNASAFKLVAPPAPVLYAGPTGIWTFQEVSTGKYVTSSTSRPDLYADGASTALAQSWNLAAAQGASTIQSNGTGQYVTADIGGTSALAASRAVAQAWELFTITLKQGSTEQYFINAGSNKKYIARNAQGALIPSAAATDTASAFRLVAPPAPALKTAYAGPSGTWALQEVSTGNFITSMSSRTDLYADATTSALAQSWNFNSSKSFTTIQSNVTGQYVTADSSGKSALSATRAIAQAWEQYTFTLKAGSTDQYTIIAASNNNYVTLNSSGALISSETAASSAAAFKLVEPALPGNPFGTYYIQDKETQKYVVAAGTSSQLVASATSKTVATIFNFTGSALSIQSTTNKQYVTAALAGSSPISATRAAASTWESFWVDEKNDNSVMLIALVNNLYLATARSGAIYNNASGQSSASLYNLVKV